MRLGFLLATARDEDLALLCRLTLAALEAGNEVSLFLMHEGAVQANRKESGKLLDAGADGAVCATNLEAFRLGAPRALPVGSQLDHAALLRRCDRLVTLA